MRRICVYSGSNPGNRPEYKEVIKRLSDVFVKNNIELVYGGSNIGLMGEMADRMLNMGGKVTGVMPKGLFPTKVNHIGLTEFIETPDMRERKKVMAELSDGFIALPGGIGTFEELFETLSFAQLGIHKKPVGALNVLGFYNPLLELLKNTAREGFMKESNINLLLVSSEPEELFEKMSNYVPFDLGTKWVELEEKK